MADGCTEQAAFAIFADVSQIVKGSEGGGCGLPRSCWLPRVKRVNRAVETCAERTRRQASASEGVGKNGICQLRISQQCCARWRSFYSCTIVV